jgi:hypothetical protein
MGPASSKRRGRAGPAYLQYSESSGSWTKGFDAKGFLRNGYSRQSRRQFVLILPAASMLLQSLIGDRRAGAE